MLGSRFADDVSSLWRRKVSQSTHERPSIGVQLGGGGANVVHDFTIEGQEGEFNVWV